MFQAGNIYSFWHFLTNDITFLKQMKIAHFWLVQVDSQRLDAKNMWVFVSCLYDPPSGHESHSSVQVGACMWGLRAAFRSTDQFTKVGEDLKMFMG